MEWISVKDRLPEYDIDCLAFVSNITGSVTYNIIGYICSVSKLWNHISEPFNESEYSITHWMPLPEPPKQYI